MGRTVGSFGRLAAGLGLVGTCALAGGVGATASTSEGAAPVPVVDLVPGRADARVEITPDGRRAIVHQGSSYDPEALLTVDLTASPAQVVGQVPVAADTGSALALVGGAFAWTTDDRDLWVTDVRDAQPRVVGRVGLRVKGGRATLFDLAVPRGGKLGYALADSGIHAPARNLLVLKVRKDGRPKAVRSVSVQADRLAVSRDGKRLAAAFGGRVHLFDLRRASQPRRLGGPVTVRGDVRALSFGASSKDLYVLTTGGTLGVHRVHTGRGRVVARSTLVSGASSAVGGDVAVSADGSRVVATTDGSDDENPSVWALDARLRSVASTTGPCYPGSVTASLSGPTRGQVYVADSGICEQARLWQVSP